MNEMNLEERVHALEIKLVLLEHKLNGLITASAEKPTDQKVTLEDKS